MTVPRLPPNTLLGSARLYACSSGPGAWALSFALQTSYSLGPGILPTFHTKPETPSFLQESPRGPVAALPPPPEAIFLR